MRYALIMFISILVLSSCQSQVVTDDIEAVDDSVTADQNPAATDLNNGVDTDNTNTRDDTDSAGSEAGSDKESETSDDNKERPALIAADIVDAPSYTQYKGSCKKDVKGVVRVFDEAGKKTVYRNECVQGILTLYNCDEAAPTVKSENKRCPKGCKDTPYGAVCL